MVQVTSLMVQVTLSPFLVMVQVTLSPFFYSYFPKICFISFPNKQKAEDSIRKYLKNHFIPLHCNVVLFRALVLNCANNVLHSA